MTLIQLDDRLIISPQQVLIACRGEDGSIHGNQHVVVLFRGRNGEEKRTIPDISGRVWSAIRRNAEGNG